MPTHEIIDFPNPSRLDEEKLRKAKAEAERLANQPEVERAFRIPNSAEVLGIEVSVFRAMVHAVLKAKAEQVAAEHLKQSRGRQQKLREQKAEDQKQEKAEKEKSRKQELAEKAAKLAKEKAEKEAKKEADRKTKEKAKALANILRLPVAQHDGELVKLAKQLGEDVTALRQELKKFAGVTEGMITRETEPWPESVDLTKLLAELSGKIARYVAIPQPHQMDAALLWVAHCWTYDHGVPIHSPMLAATSAEPDSGKSTLITVLGHATPRFKLGVEMTGPTLFRFVDQHKPTLALDEADDIFKRRPDLKHIINEGWTRSGKIPRMEKIGGVLRTVWFDPFTPKMIALLGSNLPQATRTRCIELRMVPRRPDETVEEFNETDDTEFATLRRKFSRWAADNAAALRDAKPIMPAGLNNRAAANWKVLLSTAELAGGSWPERAREAAERLSHGRSKLSNGRQLLAAIKTVFITSGKEITSEALVGKLVEDPTDLWVAYNHGGPITQRQVAWLLSQYDIEPVQLHPTARSDFSRRGYRAEQFVDAFARYVANDPIIQSRPSPKKRKKKQRSKSRSKSRAKRQ